MKLRMTLIAILLSIIICKAQVKEADKLYIIAIEKYTVQLDSFYRKYSPGSYSKTIYLQKPDLVDSIPSLINGFQIKLITFENQRLVYKANKNKLTHTKMFPAKVTGDSLVISIVPYHGVLKGKTYNLGVSGGTEFWFKFDCNQRLFVFHRLRNWGI